jgi:hypothetical protein
MTINVAYCFDQNNDLAHRSAFANMSGVQAAAAWPAAARFCHRENYLGGTTTLGCEDNTFGARGITQLGLMSAAGVYRRKVSRAGFSERPDGMAL